jgi:hypothetical protein
MYVAGVEDGSFIRGITPSNRTPLCCAVMDGPTIIGVYLNHIEIDGLDATDKLLKMVQGPVDAFILGGVTFAGFNIIDPFKVYEAFKVPVIIYAEKYPNSEAIFKALRKNFGDWELRWGVISRLGDIHHIEIRGCPVFFEVIGASKAWASSLLEASAFVCRIPEPLRVAGLIARGLSHLGP